ncbi:MAG: UDP-N-acetylglucosamine--N-acetylmuramyl-(pentapeptide) pyrophosphoryl-undecaprenol N-acetylglucosamine transferase, partial [Acidimicrobiia bacterium]|nr:UDP-N-acetylglucosamine--N-acetylmuramyl-(pentapeptide) pyrophosphoryl-undecaprenol N-acetylglucosamine transferase [Acidimicrobiia bacterium]
MIIITGGGTAGHTNPGIAVAEALVEAGVPRRDIHFVGGERGNEATLVGEAGFSIDLLPGRGIQRKLTTENLGSVLGLLKGMAKGLAIVSKRKPDVVVCLGGYAAFAASAAAVLRRIPIVVTEQNARASAVNRLFGRWAKVCALPFPDTDLPNGVVTGNPIRAAIVESVVHNTPTDARKRLVERRLPGHDPSVLDGRVVLAVWTGSLGATRINKAVRELAQRWVDRGNLAIYHIIGRRDWDDFRQDPPESGHDGVL